MGLRVKTVTGLTEETYVLDLSGVGFTHTDGGRGEDVRVGNGGSLGVIPESFGAVGDGVIDDTAALEAWVASTLPLALRPGKTYLHRRQIQMATAGQTLTGNGGILKRAAQAVTTTTTAITSGVTSQITVANAAGFRVNDQITVEQSNSYDPAPRTISSIVGNVITVSGTFGITLSGTTNVRTTWMQLLMHGDDIRVTGVVIDGNSTNWSWARWVNTVGLYIVGTATANNVADRNKIINQPGDGIAVIDTKDARVTLNTITSCNGRGISIGGNALGPRIVYNRLLNCELDAAVYQSPTFGADGSNDGHGCIQLSNPVSDLVIHGNRIESGIEGVGSISSSDNSDVTISNNEIRTMSSFAIDAVTGATHPVNNVVIAGNRIYSCGAVQIAMAGTTVVPGNARFILNGNLFSETPVFIACSQQVAVSGNVFYSAGTALNLCRLGNNGGSIGTIDTLVQGNVFVGGATAVVLDNFVTGVSVSGNRLVNQATAGVSTTGSTGSNVQITNNVIVGPSSGTTYNGIVVTATHEVKNNTIDMVSAGNNAIQAGATCVKARIVGNTCTAVNGAKSGIGITAGAATTELRDNYANTTYTDSGTGTIKSGNRINATAASAGRAVLVAGTVTVNTGEVLTGDNILLTNVVVGGTVGVLSVGTIVNKTSFVINSSNAADTSTVYWEIRH